jgi:hypothetical protein
MPRHLDDWIAETPESIAARLAAAREVQRQARFTLGFLAVISMMMLILAYNAYLSFDSRWILQRAKPAANEAPSTVANPGGALDRLALASMRDFFFLFPALASLCVFCLDRLSYFQEDPFAPRLEPLGMDAPFFFASAVVFVVCWIPLLMCCRGSARYSRATGNVLRDYGRRLQSDLLRRDSQEQRLS